MTCYVDSDEHRQLEEQPMECLSVAQQILLPEIVCVCVAINTVPLRCIIKFHVKDPGDNADGSGVPGNI